MKALKVYDLNITIYDPWADIAIAKREYRVDIVNELPKDKFDSVVLAVAHDEFKSLDMPPLVKDNHVIYDVKWILNSECDGKL